MNSAVLLLQLLLFYNILNIAYKYSGKQEKIF